MTKEDFYYCYRTAEALYGRTATELDLERAWRRYQDITKEKE